MSAKSNVVQMHDVCGASLEDALRLLHGFIPFCSTTLVGNNQISSTKLPFVCVCSFGNRKGSGISAKIRNDTLMTLAARSEKEVPTTDVCVLLCCASLV
jgi:hypothetical protein